MTNYEHYKDKLMETNEGIRIIDGVPHFDGCFGKMCDGCIRDANGCCSDAKLIEWLFSEYEESPVDWSKVPVDTPILVKGAFSEEWVQRHFAKYENGKVYAWVFGSTSYTAPIVSHSKNANVFCISWAYAKLAKEEDKND